MPTTLKIQSLVVLLLSLVLVPGAAAAGPTIEAPGKLKLEKTFGNHRLSNPSVLDVQATADGSLLIGTSNLGNLGPDGASVAKLTPDLEPDLSFGSGGVVGPNGLGAADRQHSSASALLPLPSGRILVAGATGAQKSKPQIYVSRLLADGSLDPEFADGGVSLLDPVAGREQTRRDALVLQPDGGIVLGFDVRNNGPGQVGVLRLTPSGEVDPAFGDGGSVLIPVTTLRPILLRDLPGWNLGATAGYDVAVDSTGNLALVGTERVRRPGIYRQRPVVVRMDADGALPVSAATVLRGRPRKTGSWTRHATTVGFDAADRIVIGGGAARFEGRREFGYFTFDRLLASGEPDAGFGSGGRRFLPVHPGDFETGAVDMTIDPKGKILAAGPYAGENPVGYLGSTALARVRPNGKPDRRFGKRGVFKLRANEDDGTAVAIDPERRIVVAGRDRLTRLR